VRSLVLELLAFLPEFVAVLSARSPQVSNLTFQKVKVDVRQRLLAEMVDVGVDQ
jgi:hypothetical protein